MTKNQSTTQQSNDLKNRGKDREGFKCAMYRALFRLLPCTPWQMFIMNRHMADCPSCRELAEPSPYPAESSVDSVLVSPVQASQLPSLWPELQDRLLSAPGFQTAHSRPRRFYVRRFAAAALLIAAFIILLPFFTGPGKIDDDNAGKQIMVKNVKIDSRDARFYIIHSEDPDKLIVWTQKN